MINLFQKIHRKLKHEIYLLDQLRIKNANERRERNLNDAKKILGFGERFDPIIAKKIKWVEHNHSTRYNFAKKFICKSDTVLDIACGTGYGTKLISENCKKIIGVDISQTAIRYACKTYKNKNIKYILSSFFTYNKVVDVVISFETIEHIEVSSFKMILNHLNNLAKKKIIGSVPYNETSGDNPYHLHFNLIEDGLCFFKKYGKINFYYQTNEGKIYNNFPHYKTIQNLIFVVDKH